MKCLLIFEVFGSKVLAATLVRRDNIYGLLTCYQTSVKLTIL